MAEKLKITPGPWKHTSQLQCKGTDYFQQYVEEVGETNGDWPIAEFFGPDRIANARAVAVLPALIRAAERAEKELDMAAGQIERDGHSEHAEDCRIAINHIRSALSKINGGGNG